MPATGEIDDRAGELRRPLREYQFVVVDEAHNYRNPDTRTRAAVLRKLLRSQRRDVLLLTYQLWTRRLRDKLAC